MSDPTGYDADRLEESVDHDRHGSMEERSVASESAGGDGFRAEASASGAGGEIERGDVTTSGSDQPGTVDVRGGGMGSAWITLVVGALLLIVLLVFVLQNQKAVDIAFLGWNFTMPVGVLILFAAIVGALVMALLAAMRILQLRHRAHKASQVAHSRRGRRSRR